MANFLDYRCPDCGDEDHIEVSATIWVRLTADGTDTDAAELGGHDYTPRSDARCAQCGHDGAFMDFEPTQLIQVLQEALTALNTARNFRVPALDTSSYRIAERCQAALRAAQAAPAADALAVSDRAAAVSANGTGGSGSGGARYIIVADSEPGDTLKALLYWNWVDGWKEEERFATTYAEPPGHLPRGAHNVRVITRPASPHEPHNGWS